MPGVKHCWNTSADEHSLLFLVLLFPPPGHFFGGAFSFVTFEGDLPLPLCSRQSGFLGGLGKKCVINFQEIQMCALLPASCLFSRCCHPQPSTENVGSTDSLYKNPIFFFFISLVEVSAVQLCTTLNPSGSLSKHSHCLQHLSFPHYPQICVQQWQSK